MCQSILALQQSAITNNRYKSQAETIKICMRKRTSTKYVRTPARYYGRIVLVTMDNNATY